MPRVSLSLRCLALLVLLAQGNPARAQWLTQTNELKAGWNAVYLHVDPSQATLDDLIGSDLTVPIEEVWLWQPSPTTGQFVDNPQTPTVANSQWSSWSRALGPASALHRLGGNVACLVRVQNAVPTYSWKIKGRPVALRYQWTGSGLNFLGFPTPSVSPPNYEAFLSRQPDLLQTAEIFRYPGGDLGANNPVRLFALRTTPLTRGEAVWIRSGQVFNRYFGPLQVDLQAGDGPSFGDRLGQYRIRVRNVTSETLSFRLALLSSETAPGGQTPIAGVPPILLRGSLNPTNLTYGFTSLNAGAQSFQLAPYGQPDSEREVVVGIDRSAMSGVPGVLFAGVLRITDSLNLSQQDLPVSATVASTSGLWVGEATVSQVRHYLRQFQRDNSGAPVVDASGRYIPVSTDASLGSVSRPFHLRLIVHHDQQSGQASLLQRVYYGLGLTGNQVVATREDLLSTTNKSAARRVTAVHLPWTEANNPWPFTGSMAVGSTVSAVVPLAYDDRASNPFVHEYHPDHDNLNATFDQALPQGGESYGVDRTVKLSFAAPPSDFNSLTIGGLNLTGDYEETVTFRGKGSESRDFNVRGVFSLGRVSDIATLSK